MLIDTIIQARWLIPIEPKDVVYDYYSIAIHQGLIVDILPTHQMGQQYQATETVVLDNHVLLPGFVNCHTHAAMTLLRGIADDLPLMEWLEKHIWVLEQQWVSAEFVKDGTQLAIAEMIRSGTTCFNDMYFFPEVTAQCASEYGIRASIGLIVVDFPTVWAKDSDEYIAKGLALHKQWHNHPLINLTFAPHAPYTVSDAPLLRIKQLSDTLNLPVHIHVHETAHEVQSVPVRPLQRLHELGLVNSSLLAVHATQLTADEIELLAKQNAHIVHCPESNLKLASGFCPVDSCLKAGINVALGTDGAASNNDLDMLGEMRTGALIGKAVANSASAIPAMTALQMATINGAKALGLENKIGSLTIGKSADMIAIDMSSLEMQPLYSIISHLVYTVQRNQITDVWINGKRLLNNRDLTTVNLTELHNKITFWQKRLSK